MAFDSTPVFLASTPMKANNIDSVSIESGPTLSVENTNAAIQRKFRFGGRNRNLPWYPRKGTRADLTLLFKDLGFKEGAEIGVQRGHFSEALCVANPNLHLYSIDPWAFIPDQISQERQDGHYANAIKRLSNYNVTVIRKPSLEAVKEFKDESLDFVYIDGDHFFDAAVQDLIAWVPKVKIGGIVAAHDYHTQCGADVIKAVDAYTHCHGIYPWYVTREELPTAYWVRANGKSIRLA